MFNSLVESGSHKRDLKRKGTFLLGTLGFYVALLSVAGVGSIYAYNARLEEPEYEVLALMRFAPPSPEDAQPKREQPRAATRATSEPRATTRPEISVQTPYNENRAVADMNTKEVSARTRVVIAPRTQDATEQGGPIGPVGPDTGGPGVGVKPGGLPVVRPEPEDAAPEMKRAAPQPTPQKRTQTISLGVINGRAQDLPTPVYSAVAKAARAQGMVTVQILVDETGRVISAHATGGHPMLRPLAEQAARRARFSPTLLSNQPVKVSGVITYNFVLQ